jgi:phytanoyl-CoA hydroxylase
MGETETALRRHEWNTSFQWQDRQGPFRRVTDDQAAQFDRDGYVVIDDLVDAETLAEVTAEIDRFEAKVDEFLKTQPDERVMIAESGALTVTLHVASQSPVLRALVSSPALVDVCADLIGPDVNLYWDQAVYKKPEKPRRVPWHQDNGYTYIEPQQYLTIWLALTDATLDNGCPHVAPGLHKYGTLAHYYVEPLGFECFEDPPREATAPVKAGGAVVFSSLMPHLTGPNLTDEVRKAYIVQYAPAGAYTRTEAGNVPCDDPRRQFAVLRDGQYV